MIPAAAAARRRRLHLNPVLLLQRQPLIGDVGERRGDDDDRPRRDQRADDIPPHHLPLPAGEVYREAGGARRRRRRQEGAGQGEDLEAAVERGDAPRGGRLAEADVVDGAGAAEDADAPLALGGVGGDRLEDVAAAADLEDVGAEGVGALARDDHGRLGLVLGARGAPPLAARRRFGGGGVGVVGVVAGEVVPVVGVIFGFRRRGVEVAVEGRNEVGSRT